MCRTTCMSQQRVSETLVSGEVLDATEGPQLFVSVVHNSPVLHFPEKTRLWCSYAVRSASHIQETCRVDTATRLVAMHGRNRGRFQEP